MNPTFSTCHVAKLFAELQKRWQKFLFFRKEPFSPESLSRHLECSFNNNAEDSARYTKSIKKIFTAPKLNSFSSDPLHGWNSVLLNHQIFFRKTKFFRQKYKKHNFFLPTGHLYLPIVQNLWQNLMQFQQKNPFPKNSFGQIEYKFNNTDKKVPSKVPIFWNHDLEISFRK